LDEEHFTIQASLIEGVKKMKKLVFVYPEAVEHTKQKIRDDIIFFLQEKEYLPTFNDYLNERKQYIEQIWINVWINRASNQVPRSEKKEYLNSRGFEVEGVDRKIINTLFRSEIKGYHPFKVEGWLQETYADKKEMWNRMYDEARTNYKKRQIERSLLEEQKRVNLAIYEVVDKLITDHRHDLYLMLRKYIADSVKIDFHSKMRFQKLDPYLIEERLVIQGPFDVSQYSTISDFFTELTGEIQKISNWDHVDYEYEQYSDVYQKKVFEYLTDIVPKYIQNLLDPELTANEDPVVVCKAIKETIAGRINNLSKELYSFLGDEYVSDLLKLAEIPFELKEHQRIFIQDIEWREKRKAEERAEIQRIKEEEARILNEIFELEYNPPSGRNVHYVLHIGETNTGKTYHALQRMMAAESGMYLAPLRLLALEVSDFLNAQGTPCSLKTGEEERLVPHANHISCTVEMFHEKSFYEVVVIDEAQMISDKNRGFSWYKAITKVQAKEVHIIASLNAREMLVQLLGDSKIEIIEYKRDTPLEVEKKEFKIKHVEKGDALICFSRKRVLETASKLQNDGHSVSMIYGSMPPETRKKQVDRFIKGETNIIVSTDAIGMGLNLPIRRIVFLENSKFDGTSRRRLTSQEIKQIAGRAGRKGLYEIGRVSFHEDVKTMEKLLLQSDEPIHTFTIAPTNAVFERFMKYYHDLGTFFELWHKFRSPHGTKKASLSEEKELYELVRGSEMEARLSLMDLYGLLHLPFSTRENELIRQWKKTAEAIVLGNELPEPKIKQRTLEDLELSYKAIGLHLLFLYRLNKQTEAIYWERLREEISLLVHEKLKTEVKDMKKKCRQCNKKLPWDHRFQICDSCYSHRFRHNDYY
jgi:ATP-dependent RNA helicase SUPV3L1/SUV3